MDDAEAVHEQIKKENRLFAAQRDDEYVSRRKALEELAYTGFIKKGGKPKNRYPHYMVVEECPWLETWYPSPRAIKIPIVDLDMEEISFTYGDLFPTFSDEVNDEKEYRKKIYTWDEMKALIGKYGLPQIWNSDGKHGPERYIEAQVWTSREVIVRKAARE
ncbi:MAG: hypothetical protein JXD23_04205 [Spirochaetales bacterium]|nr:hypothetical protein [Spirochaetales bacterium]